MLQTGLQQALASRDFNSYKFKVHVHQTLVFNNQKRLQTNQSKPGVQRQLQDGLYWIKLQNFTQSCHDCERQGNQKQLLVEFYPVDCAVLSIESARNCPYSLHGKSQGCSYIRKH